MVDVRTLSKFLQRVEIFSSIFWSLTCYNLDEINLTGCRKIATVATLNCSGTPVLLREVAQICPQVGNAKRLTGQATNSVIKLVRFHFGKNVSRISEVVL